MNKIIRSKDYNEIKYLIQNFSVTAILGPRQCGKTTLARDFKADHYFDLENPRDIARLDQPQLALENLNGLIVIDEIQRIPEIFPLIRYLVDNNPEQKYLILGSASSELIKQSSETLAGRIAYCYLGGFRLSDIGSDNLQTLWFRGGFPKSYLPATHRQSITWRENYITSFLERDLPQLGINIPANTLRRFWTMLAHYHGQVLNYSELGRSFGISDMKARTYIDILEGTFMVRLLQPWFNNTGKRLVKSPKLYLQDAGIFHSLQTINSMEQLLSHNKLGASWEGFVLENVCRSIGKRNHEFYFWKTHAGAELDLFWQHNGKNWGIEVKYHDAPTLSKSMKIACQDLELEALWVIYPGNSEYKIAENISALPLKNISDTWNYDLS
ncbi:MAG: ATP-binding protein [Desulfobacterales bacterium]|nr:ATP-binding protein [Desulfobacterales bacterium]